MTGKKKVLCFMPSMPDGAQRMMLTLLKQLDPDKYNVKIVIVHQKLLGIENFIPQHFDMLHIKIRNIWDFTITKMVKAIRKEKADFLFSSIFYMNLRVVIAGKLTGVPVILRNDNYVSIMSRRQRWVTNTVYKWAKCVIMQQEEMLDEFKQTFHFPDNKMVVIHNPIDTETIDRLIDEPSPYPNEDQVKFVNVARFKRKKGQDVLAEAFIKVHEKIPNAHLYYVGNYKEVNPIYDKVLEIIRLAGLEKYVHFVGQQMNPYKWMKHSDCFVLSSRLEGLPNVLLEAMYIGKPVVSTTCIDVISRIVKDGYNGYLVPSESPTALAEAMIKALVLKDFKMTYKPDDMELFRKLFT